jgi:hypothetical protein
MTTLDNSKAISKYPWKVLARLIQTRKEAEKNFNIQLAGPLYFSKDTNYLLLKVPNEFTKELFECFKGDSGFEYPRPIGGEDEYQAHVAVMKDDEVASIEQSGKSASDFEELGSDFKYNITGVSQLKCDSQSKFDRVLVVNVTSDDLEKIRKDHGLSPTGKHGFHITFAIKYGADNAGDSLVKSSEEEKPSTTWLSKDLRDDLIRGGLGSLAALAGENLSNNVSSKFVINSISKGPKLPRLTYEEHRQIAKDIGTTQVPTMIVNDFSSKPTHYQARPLVTDDGALVVDNLYSIDDFYGNTRDAKPRGLITVRKNLDILPAVAHEYGHAMTRDPVKGNALLRLNDRYLVPISKTTGIVAPIVAAILASRYYQHKTHTGGDQSTFKRVAIPLGSALTTAAVFNAPVLTSEFLATRHARKAIDKYYERKLKAVRPGARQAKSYELQKQKSHSILDAAFRSYYLPPLIATLIGTIGSGVLNRSNSS